MFLVDTRSIVNSSSTVKLFYVSTANQMFKL